MTSATDRSKAVDLVIILLCEAFCLLLHVSILSLVLLYFLFLYSNNCNYHLSGKELFIRFTARAFRKLLSIYVLSYFPFSFEGKIWNLIVSVPDHSLSFFFSVAC